MMTAFLALTSWLLAAAPQALTAPLEPISIACPDLAQPEGKTRWDLTACAATPPLPRPSFSDPTGGDAAARWLRPEAFLEGRVPGSEVVLTLDEATPAGPDRLFIRTRIVGVGWLHLPSGVRDVLLERALILRRRAHSPKYEPDQLVHRFLARDGGVLASAGGPPSADGHARTSLARVELSASLPALTPLTKMYELEVVGELQGAVNYGWDRGLNTAVSAVTTLPHATMGALVDAAAWDFSQNGERHPIAGTTTANASTSITGSGTSFQTALAVGDKLSLSSSPAAYARITAISSNTQLTLSAPLGNGTTQTIFRKSAEVASTSVAVSPAETCNATNCGYTVAGGSMDREDKNFEEKTCSQTTTQLCTLDAQCPVGQRCIGRYTNAVSERVETPGVDVTHWLRAGAVNEGLAGAFGSGESKFCYTSFGAVTRTPAPLWRFAHQDAGGYYLQVGDTWSSAPFACEQNLFNQVCTSSCGFLCQLYTKACSDHTGTQSGQVLKAGVITLPSGHTFNALLVRTVADFCVYITSACSTPLSQVRTVVHLWQVPHLGTVARLNSPQEAPADLRSFSTLGESNISFGLFPPRTIQFVSATDTSVSLSWDPGLDTRRINSYRIYWDTDSGGSNAYAFDSLTHAGQVAFAGTNATVTGLTPGTTYYFTVTSRSAFTDPSSGIVTTYESKRYPTQIFGDPGFVVPVEVQGATTGGACIPTAEVTGLRVNRSGANVEICWDPVVDSCAIGYRVLGASSPVSDAGFATVADSGLTTCWTGASAASYFLVVARSASATGPWGHFGH